jgi:Dual-action HEIGH metallo-peptidase
MSHRGIQSSYAPTRRKRSHTFFPWGILIFLLLLVGSPTPSASSPQQPPTDQDKGMQVDRHAFIDIAAKWASPNIAVCWENATPTFSREMSMVREAVASTWEAASQLRFTGWANCVPDNRGIRILIDDSGPHTKGLGNRLNGVRNGMVLNFTFNNWSPDCKKMRDYCIKTIVVHEFGHAIAFAHEQNRADAPGECQNLRQGSDGTALLTPYDPDSVMNYCNPAYNNDGQLSKYDKEAVAAMYGAPVNASRTINKRAGRRRM